MKTIRLKHSVTVEQYLANDLSPIEREAFEHDLNTNPELESEFRFASSIDRALRQEEILDLRRKIQKVMKESKQTKADPIIIRYRPNRIWYAAASFLIIATFAATMLISNYRHSSPESLFKKYYTSENIIDITRSGNTNLVEAVMRFQKKEYDMASRLFSEILDNDSRNMAVWFYYGISCIETENYGKAEKAFNEIINNKYNLYVEHAEWYLALTYLKDKKMDKAITAFKKVADNSENFHRQNAAHILKNLKK